jgi:hypothetical protein
MNEAARNLRRTLAKKLSDRGVRVPSVELQRSGPACTTVVDAPK